MRARQTRAHALVALTQRPVQHHRPCRPAHRYSMWLWKAGRVEACGGAWKQKRTSTQLPMGTQTRRYTLDSATALPPRNSTPATVGQGTTMLNETAERTVFRRHAPDKRRWSMTKEFAVWRPQGTPFFKRTVRVRPAVYRCGLQMSFSAAARREHNVKRVIKKGLSPSSTPNPSTASHPRRPPPFPLPLLSASITNPEAPPSSPDLSQLAHFTPPASIYLPQSTHPVTRMEQPSSTVSSHEESDDEVVVNSIRLQYPKSSRLLLGTTVNIQHPGFIKALETSYPLELSLECHDLTTPPRLLPRLPAMRGGSRADRKWLLRPFAVFFYRTGGPEMAWELIGRTETIAYDDYHRFVTKLKVGCATPEDRRKELRMEVYDRRSKSDVVEDHVFIGAAHCSLDDIISEPLLRRELRLESGRTLEPGRAIISADAIRPTGESHKITLNVDMASITKGPHRVFFVLSRQLQSGDYTAVYRSEVLGKDEKKFKTVSRNTSAVTAGVDDKLLRLELFQYNPRGPHMKLGFMQTSVDKLKSTAHGSSLLWWPSSSCDGDNVIEVGRVVLLESYVSEENLRFRLRVTQ